jgi:hypothetical protein
MNPMKPNSVKGDEEAWVLLAHFPYEPTKVYGFFRTNKEAMDYAQRQGFGGEGAFEAKMVLDHGTSTEELTK